MKAVDARRPAIYLVVGAALALVAALFGAGTTGASTGSPPAPEAAAPAAPGPGCTQIRQSLRPQGPLPAPGSMPPGTTMAAIAERGRLIAGVDQGKFLAGYRNSLTGNLEGSDIDVVRRIAEAIFGDPERVQYVVLNIADRATALERDQVDVVVNSFTVTCERQRLVEFSSPIMPAVQRLLVPLGSGINEVEDLGGRTVCTSIGSTTEITLHDLGLQVVSLPGIPDCVLELQRGRVAAVSSDDVILAGLAAQDPNTRVVGRALATAEYAVGMRPDEPDLVRFVNGVLEEARADGSLAAGNRHWFTGRLDPVPLPPPPVYRD